MEGFNIRDLKESLNKALMAKVSVLEVFIILIISVTLILSVSFHFLSKHEINFLKINSQLEGQSQSISDLEKTQIENKYALEEEIKKASEDFNKEIKKTSENFNKENKKIRKKVFNQFGQFEDRLKAIEENKVDKKDFIESQRQVDYLSNILSQPDKNTKAFENFSYYLSEEWKNEKTAFLQQLNKVGIRYSVINALQGVDTLKLDSNQTVVVGGLTSTSVEIFNIQNDKKNNVYIIAPGLVDLENDQVEIITDVNSDLVYLDGCLQWKEIPSGYNKTFVAQDKSGATRSVKLDVNQRVVRMENCEPDYFKFYQKAVLERFSKKLGTASDLERNHAQKINSIPESHIVTDVYDDENIGIYKHALNKLKSPKAKKNFSLLIELMEKGILPTEFPRMQNVASSERKYILNPLQFDRGYVEEYNRNTSFKCDPRKNRSGDPISFFNIDNEGITDIKCARGDQIYSLSNGIEYLDDSWGNDIVFPGGGKDLLDLGWGQDIVVLEKNWGEKEIRKTCHHTSPRQDELYTDYFARNIDDRSKKQLWRTAYKWPYKYNSFIVLGPGIKQADIRVLRQKIVNLKTGDEASFSDCFNVIYSDEFRQESNRQDMNLETRGAGQIKQQSSQSINIEEKQETATTNEEKINRALTEIRSVQSATNAFLDQYNSLPGDFSKAKKMFSRCDKCGEGNQDGIVGDGSISRVDLNDERFFFWQHLHYANLLGEYTAEDKLKWGAAFPRSVLGGGFHVFTLENNDALPNKFSNTQARKGLYLYLTNNVSGDLGDPNAHPLTAYEASQLDRRLDDGLPLRGDVIVVGKQECIVESEGTVKYRDISDQQKKCFSLFYRLASAGRKTKR